MTYISEFLLPVKIAGKENYRKVAAAVEEMFKQYGTPLFDPQRSTVGSLEPIV